MEDGRKRIYKNKYYKKSSSGRVVKTPKNVMTTSSDEERRKHTKKKSSQQYSMQMQLNKLEALVQNMPKNDTFPNTDATFSSKSNDTIFNSPVKDS